eukprot:SAG11_NODE_20203_length_450_cov_1.461538_1_plen_20_part_10
MRRTTACGIGKLHLPFEAMH